MASLCVVVGAAGVIIIIAVFLFATLSSSGGGMVVQQEQVPALTEPVPAPEVETKPEPDTSVPATQAPPPSSSSAVPKTNAPKHISHYTNSLYGFEVAVPAGLLLVDEQESGADFENSSNGMKVSVYGDKNSRGLSVNDIYEATLENLASIGVDPSYRTSTDTMFVVSYVENVAGTDVIIYMMTYVSNSTVCAIQFSYPKANKSECDPILENMVGTFSPY